MILASAQTRPKRGNILENLDDHYRLIEIAADKGADLIVFPEMSITGYEREKAHFLSFSRTDDRLDKLTRMAVDNEIIVIAGAPIIINSDLFIGEFIMFPDSSVKIYTKQFLHPGEEVYFKSSFDHNPIIELKNERISLAICADIDHYLHAENAGKVESSMYISSLFFSPNGIPSAHNLLSNYAKIYSMNVLMSNFSGESWGQPAGGRSAFWNKNGELIAEMSNYNSGLLIVEKSNDELWTGKVFNDQ
jgi:predicted amidohydrolase